MTQFCAILIASFAWLCCQNDPLPPASGAASTTPPLIEQRLVADATTPKPTVDLDYLMGKFDPNKHPDFVTVGAPYSDKPGMMLRKETFEKFKEMWQAAKKDGITLKIISSTRNFDQQKAIWERKWANFAKDHPKPVDRALKILEYSSMPGTSRHHWGTDMDLNELRNESFEGRGELAKLYEWLQQHAHEYGFCQPYTPQGAERPNGYHEEKWHWSFTPLSKHFLETYRQTVKSEQITGFKGAETAADVQAIEHYVSGINTACQ